MDKSYKSTSFEQRVTYALDTDSKLHIIENVPARVDEETSEQFFAPSTVERLQETILAQADPKKICRNPFM